MGVKGYRDPLCAIRKLSLYIHCLITTYFYAAEIICYVFRLYRLMIGHALGNVSRVRHVPLPLASIEPRLLNTPYGLCFLRISLVLRFIRLFEEFWWFSSSKTHTYCSPVIYLLTFLFSVEFKSHFVTVYELLSNVKLPYKYKWFKCTYCYMNSLLIHLLRVFRWHHFQPFSWIIYK